MLNILRSNQEYNNNLKKYTKKDGLLALLLFVIMTFFIIIQGVLYVKVDFVRDNSRLVSGVFYFLMIIITLFFILIRKQDLDTIGFGGRWKLSLLIGGLLSLIYFYNNCLSHLMNGEKMIPFPEVVSLAIFYFFVAFGEEIVFRCYINTRLYGLIKNKFVVLIVTGVLFVVMHFPYRMIAYGMTLSDLTINNMSWIINVFVFHFMLSFIYMKTNSIFGIIIPHWISDLAYAIVLK